MRTVKKPDRSGLMDLEELHRQQVPEGDLPQDGSLDGITYLGSSATFQGPPNGEILHTVCERNKGRLRGAYERIGRMRSVTLQTRLKAHEKRNELRNERDTVTDSDSRLMQTMHTFFSQNSSEEFKELIDLYEKCRDARDSYQPLEVSYNSLEDQLDQQEYELDEAERKLYERHEESEFDSTVLVGDQSAASSSSFQEHFIDYPAVVMDWLSRRADAQLTQERLYELRAHRAELVETRRTRKKVGLELDPDSQRFLSDFDSEHNRLQRELSAIEADVAEFARIGVDEAFINSTIDTGLDEILQIDDTPPIDSLKLDDPDKNLRISDLNEPQNRDRSLVTVHTEEPLDKAKFVNDWLLWRLRASQQEILHLKYHINQKSPTEISAINKVILDLWSRDEAATRTILPPLSLSSISSNTTKNDFPRRATSQHDERDRASFLFSRSTEF